VSEDGVVYSQWVLIRDDYGRFCSVLGQDLQELIPWLVGGYQVVALRKDGQTKKPYVHVIVAEAFLGLCPKGMEVCHEDGTRDNNHYKNLRYDTRKGNLADRERHGTDQRGERNPAVKLTDKQVADIRQRRVRGELVRVLAVEFGVGEAQISRIANGLRRT
jgi:hypothetical protein